jgi:hypothetical protein
VTGLYWKAGHFLSAEKRQQTGVGRWENPATELTGLYWKAGHFLSAEKRQQTGVGRWDNPATELTGLYWKAEQLLFHFTETQNLLWLLHTIPDIIQFPN